MLLIDLTMKFVRDGKRGYPKPPNRLLPKKARIPQLYKKGKGF